MTQPPTCPSCGATVALPPDLSVLTLRCHYCGTEQPVPDLDARRRALAQIRREEEARKEAAEIRTEVQQQQRAARRSARWMMLPGLLIGGICVVAGMVPVLRMSFGPLLGSSWDGTNSFTCVGVDDLKVSDVTVKLGGTAIYARGNCHLSIEGAHLRAGTVIDASDNAHVVLRGGSADGAPVFAVVAGNAVVDVRGARVTGTVKKSGNARVTGYP
jgi:hypothetical protein